MAIDPRTSGMYGSAYIPNNTRQSAYGGVTSTNLYGGSANPYYDPLAEAAKINTLNRAAQQQSNLARLPNAPALEATSSGNILKLLQGEIPTDVLGRISTAAAERGVATGLSGSPNASAAYLRALGLTSLDMTERGEKDLAGAYARNPGAPITDATRFMMTPGELTQRDLTLKRLAEEKRQFDEQQRLDRERMRLQAELSALNNSYSGGPGGGQKTPAFTGANYGSSASWGDLFGNAGGNGTIFWGGPLGTGSPGTTTTASPAPISYGSYTPGAYGYQPTSSGSMYMGPAEGYYPGGESAYNTDLDALIYGTPTAEGW